MASPALPENKEPLKNPPGKGEKPSFETGQPSERAALREEVASQAEKPSVSEAPPPSPPPAVSTSPIPDAPEPPKSGWTTFTSYCHDVLDYYHAVQKERGTLSALGATILYALQRDWQAALDFVHGESGQGFEPHISEDMDSPVDPKLKDAVRTQLEGLLADPEKKTWVDTAKEIEHSSNPQYGGVPASLILSFARFESGFNPMAVPKDKKGKLLSSAKGFGQFLKATFSDFRSEVPEFANAEATDVKAGMAAIAWYAKKNALRFGIALTDPHLVQYCYEAHHEGPAGFGLLQAFRRGESVSDSQVPKSYRGRNFPSLGFPEPIWTYAQYEKLITAMSSKVQTVADLYSTLL